jgi:peptide/nickel transport system permease protein
MDGLSRLIARRLAFGVLALFIISLLIFLGVEALPGDLAQAILGHGATPETVAALRKELGLELPAYVRYGDWIGGILHGSFGRSLANKRPIVDMISGRLFNTLFLAGTAAVVAVPVAVALGVLAALYRESWFDKAISTVTLTAISFPEFFLAYILIALFAVQMRIFPPISAIEPGEPFWERLYDIALPAITMILVVVAYMMRMTRAAILSVMASPYIEMARLKGLTPRRVIVHHALPNALSPIINVIVLNLAYLVVGVVVVEVVFAYPGLGQLLVDAVAKRDLPVVQASCLIFASTYLLLNLLADVLAILANPRLRHPR